MDAPEVIDAYFMENRAKLLDIAAFLDRVERAGGGQDFRMAAFEDALEILKGKGSDRAKKLLMLFSDPTKEPIKSAAGMKGAHGAWPGYTGKETKK